MQDRPLEVYCSGLGGGLLSGEHEYDIFLQNLAQTKVYGPSLAVEVWTLVGATWHWSDLTFIEPSVVKLDYGKVSASDISCFNIAL